MEKPEGGSLKGEHLSSPQVFPRSVTDKVLPLTLQSIICLNLFLICHTYLWVLFCVEVPRAWENDPLATPAKTPPAASPWTCCPQNKEELLLNLPRLWDAAEMAMVDWDRVECQTEDVY